MLTNNNKMLKRLSEGSNIISGTMAGVLVDVMLKGSARTAVSEGRAPGLREFFGILGSS